MISGNRTNVNVTESSHTTSTRNGSTTADSTIAYVVTEVSTNSDTTFATQFGTVGTTPGMNALNLHNCSRLALLLIEMFEVIQHYDTLLHTTLHSHVTTTPSKPIYWLKLR